VAVIAPYKPEKIICGFLYGSEADYQSAKQKMSAEYGTADLESPPFKFEHTSYYTAEMGSGLFRRFVSFEKPVDPSLLSKIKLFAMNTELQLLYEGTRKRRVNIDPGLLSEPKVVLASAKNFSHRICIGNGIWAEVTLRYSGNTFTTLEWTYPDYAFPESIKFFNRVREIYRCQTR